MADPVPDELQSGTIARARRRVVGPRLRWLLRGVLVLFALLAGNSTYLAGVTFLEWTSRRWGAGLAYQDHFYLVMFLSHLVLGLLLIAPVLVFGGVHFVLARDHRNRRAARLGYGLFIAAVTVLGTGLLLIRIQGLFELKNPLARSIVYWLHVIGPLATAWLYWLHRLAGARIHWRTGLAYIGVVGVVVAPLLGWQMRSPQDLQAAGVEQAETRFAPSSARTRDGQLIPSSMLMMDDYCRQCHADAHRQWSASMHRFSSFNNPAYLATVLETRDAVLQRDGNIQAARWCGGCHDPVPFFSGAFDAPDYDFVHDPTARAGITCTVCHAITHVTSTRGNADYTIEQPIHYPFATSRNPVLQWVNRTLIKAKPSFHKQVFLKPVHKTAEFCSVCHKVNLPGEVTHYKEFLRGQNHYDSFLLSGVSGHGARSFYYPDRAEANCNGCHMPLTPSRDFGTRQFDNTAERSIHSHFFPGANTGVPWLCGQTEAIAPNQEFLRGVLRVDLFGLREGGTLDGTLHGALGPEVPRLQPGQAYLLETVIRTLKVGHHFTQGTADSNQVWLEVTARSGDRVLGRSGARDARGRVDQGAHFVNVFMLDREGQRISRRNAQDIFVPLYDHQIPPGAGQTVHYLLSLPTDIRAPVHVHVRLLYRKFDSEYLEFIARKHTQQQARGLALLPGQERGQPYLNQLPVTVLAEDEIELPVVGVDTPVTPRQREIPAWQRWNDYGIGLLLKGKAELRQAAEAFEQVRQRDRYDGPLNLARVYYREGRLDEAVAALRQAATYTDPPAPAWTLAWLSGLVNREQGHLAEAARDFRSVLDERTFEMRRRGLDFSRDYEVINELGLTLFFQAQQLFGPEQRGHRTQLYAQAVEQFQRTLTLDAENVTAHYNLAVLYRQLGQPERAAEHQRLHARYKLDDNARDRALRLARERYPEANRAAEAVVIYPLDAEPPAAAVDTAHGQPRSGVTP